ncbi:GTP-binding protein Rhes-like [Synchiropus splendidus]|uniref:GTP-binding protein Rhes-like n=1 Tax=Synchiropus splendidus TaxID=270530 RepID=UPI00237E6A7A|nr:GTP-binding protein Rhes-like [Synchiropus splendidus]
MDPGRAQTLAKIEGAQTREREDLLGSGPSKVFLAYRAATQHLSSSGVKAGLGILKLARSQWTQEKKTSAQLTPGESSHRRSTLDQLAAFVLHGHRRQIDHRQDAAYSTKPQNSKRIVVLGSPRVGKTSILRRYLRDGFVEEYQPTTEDFLRKLFRIRGETYQIDVLDASRERDFPAKRRLSILTGDIFLLVFSLDDRSSFEEVCALREEILAAKSKLSKSAAPERARLPVVVCANKVDLPETLRKVSRAEVLQELGEDCIYFETSAKDSTNLEKVFEMMAKRGGLPTETGPSGHRKVSLRSYQAVRTSGRALGGTTTPGTEVPCGALFPLARRPSFRSDLKQVIGPRHVQMNNKRAEKCPIQ